MTNKAAATYYKDEDSIAMMEDRIKVESRVRSRRTTTNTSITSAQSNSQLKKDREGVSLKQNNIVIPSDSTDDRSMASSITQESII